MIQTRKLTYELAQHPKYPDEWVVEAINYPELGLGGDGEIYAALFSGPRAKERAEEYLRLKDKQPEGQAAEL
jgi:hypothetical protein